MHRLKGRIARVLPERHFGHLKPILCNFTMDLHILCPSQPKKLTYCAKVLIITASRWFSNCGAICLLKVFVAPLSEFRSVWLHHKITFTFFFRIHSTYEITVYSLDMQGSTHFQSKFSQKTYCAYNSRMSQLQAVHQPTFFL